MQAHLRDLDDMFQLARLLLHFGREEQRCRRYRVAVEVGERVEHVETVHVNDSGVDTQLSTGQSELRRKVHRHITYNHRVCTSKLNVERYTTIDLAHYRFQRPIFNSALPNKGHFNI